MSAFWIAVTITVVGCIAVALLRAFDDLSRLKGRIDWLEQRLRVHTHDHD